MFMVARLGLILPAEIHRRHSIRLKLMQSWNDNILYNILALERKWCLRVWLWSVFFRL